MNLALGLEWIEKDPFIQFSLKFKKHERAFLTQSELELFETRSLIKSAHCKTRDVFVFACYTGLSYIDVKLLSKDNIVRGIDGRFWLHTKRQKTSELVKIPLLEKALVILNNYDLNIQKRDTKLLPIFSNQKINKYLKEITPLLNIEKWLTFHSARHTFATTVTLSNGVPIETVSKLLGHTKLSTTQIYARVVEKKISDDMFSLSEKLNFSKENSVVNS